MKITLLQADMAWRDPAGNRAHMADLAARAPGSDMLLLPEMFDTGFDPSPVVADPAPTLEWMAAMARTHNAAVAGSMAVAENGKLFNRLHFVTPDGISAHYDKRHLFSHARENEAYHAGDRRVVVEWRSARILLQICYDLRFPVFSRCRGDYDMIVYVASWPASRIGAWDALLRARAIENQCYVAGVNRVGIDPAARYDGHSALIDFRGNAFVEAGTTENVVSGRLDMPQLTAFRTKFPVLADADRFELNYEWGG